jgi:GcrA cell cycle regulator
VVKLATLERAAVLQLRCVAITPRHLALVDLEADDCRYPYGGDAEGEPITFCGHPRRDGSSYCPSHFHLTSAPELLEKRQPVKTPLRLVEAA